LVLAAVGLGVYLNGAGGPPGTMTAKKPETPSITPPRVSLPVAPPKGPIVATRPPKATAPEKVAKLDLPSVLTPDLASSGPDETPAEETPIEVHTQHPSAKMRPAFVVPKVIAPPAVRKPSVVAVRQDTHPAVKDPVVAEKPLPTGNDTTAAPGNETAHSVAPEPAAPVEEPARVAETPAAEARPAMHDMLDGIRGKLTSYKESGKLFAPSAAVDHGVTDYSGTVSMVHSDIKT
jgi:hypothetical protein